MNYDGFLAMCLPMNFIFSFDSVFSKILYNKKQPKYPLTGEWIEKMWDIHTIEYGSSSERKEILIQATVWMNLKDVGKVS